MNTLSLIRNKKNTSILEFILVFGGLIFSFINVYSLIIFMLGLMLYFRQKEIGAVKILIIITLRTVINPAIAVNIGTVQNIKWLILLSVSLYLILKFKEISLNDQKKMMRVIFPFLIFALYAMFVSLLFSSLPFVSLFKVLSYILVFFGVFIGVSLSYQRVNWINYLHSTLGFIIYSSFFTINSYVGYLTNGYSFQGITNQPNTFGTLVVFFIVVLFLKYESSKNKIFDIILLLSYFASIYMLYISFSRTSTFTVIIISILFMIFSKKINLMAKILCITMVVLLSSISFQTDTRKNFIEEFIYKQDTTENSLLFSRETQFNRLIENFNKSPILGNGFGTPVLSIKSGEISTAYPVENGNIILSLLSDLGIVGLILFFLAIFNLIINNKYLVFILLPISTLIVSMGEMFYFSSNGLGPLIYIFLALYIFNPGYQTKMVK